MKKEMDMIIETKEEIVNNQNGEKKRNRKKLLIGIGIGAVISIITLGALFAIFMMLVIFGGSTKTVTDISMYKETMTKYDNLRTAFICFPEELPESARDTDFYFAYQDTWNTPTMEVYLQCTYDEKDYEAEVERLENTKKQYGSILRTLMRDEEGRYPYPVYIAVDGMWHAYEYALLSGDKQITYVYTTYKYSDNLKKIDAQYLPSDFDKRQDELKSGEGYCIYLKKVDMMDGEVMGWDTDYTRDEMVEVLEYHYVEIGYNLFGVCTVLDEKDREIIKYCYDWRYEDFHDSYNGLPEERQYKELEGYEFVSVEMNEDETKIVVTYYDNAGKEAVKEYEITDLIN